MQPIYVDFLNGPDIAALDMTDEDILGAIEASLAAQGRKQAVIEPRMHLKPDPGVDGHFNVLRGAMGGDVQRARVKVVSDFVYNYEQGLPSEMAILALFDPRTGKPQAILDAGGIADMRTGAVTTIGAKYLARKDSKILGHMFIAEKLQANSLGVADASTYDEVDTAQLAIRQSTRSSTAAPAAASLLVIVSRSLWLMPSSHGTNIIWLRQNGAMRMASCPARLRSRIVP